ncbi:MAG: M61 family metallopeptidase [Candidatus Eremiobacteraeota bacterium]|nr:M61 family metallopeptidase [Candidatus Eremiobacteraeota bacterium]
MSLLAVAALAAMTLHVDARQAPENLFHATVTMPVTPQRCRFAYPKWIPAWETPSGPIENLAGLRVTADGKSVAWHRDPVDMFQFTCDAGGASQITVSMDVIGTTPSYGYNATVNGTQNVALIQWSSLLVYPAGGNVYDQPVKASISLPAGWGYGTALETASANGGEISFAPTMLNQLVDSPLHAGAFHRSIQLSHDESPAYLDVVADSVHAMDISPATLTAMKRLVHEAPALYGPPHYEHYTFLLSLSDAIPGGGFEHHQSSDDRADEDYLTDPDELRVDPDLMSHEYSHSWNGKYRRPAGMMIQNYNEPMIDDLIWSYEGMNEYLGKLLAVRSGLSTPEDMRAQFALIAAEQSYRTGRDWRSLIDTSRSAPFLYTSPRAWANLRRTAGDFYDEGLLLWLDVDTKIRELTGGKKALDDYLHAYAAGGSRKPTVKTYTFDDIVALLDSIAPYDWRTFFADRVYAIAPKPPLEEFDRSGWHLVYRSAPTGYEKVLQSTYHFLDIAYSAGLRLGDDGSVIDVVPGSAAADAGIASGMKLTGVDGRTWTASRMLEAIDAAHENHAPITLLVQNASFVRSASVAYYGGQRYPALERLAGTPDTLTQIFAPKTPMTP